MNNKPISDSNSLKVFDISSPNKTAASPTSRPIITARQELQLDPMVKANPKPAVVQEPSKVAMPELAEIIPPEVQPAEEPSSTEKPPTENIPIIKEEKSAEPVASEFLVSAAQPANELVVATPQSTPQMVVSHHKGKKSGAWSVLVILLALIIVIVVVDVLFDAGIIKSTVPHTHFFGN